MRVDSFHMNGIVFHVSGGGAMPVVAIYMHRWSVWNVFLNILPPLQPFNVCSLGRTSAPSVKSAPVRNAPPVATNTLLAKVKYCAELVVRKHSKKWQKTLLRNSMLIGEGEKWTRCADSANFKEEEGASALSQTHPFFENPHMMPSFFRSAILFWYHIYSIILTMPTNTPRITTFVPCLLPVFFS